MDALQPLLGRIGWYGRPATGASRSAERDRWATGTWALDGLKDWRCGACQECDRRGGRACLRAHRDEKTLQARLDAS